MSTIIEAETLSELIADCAEIPEKLHAGGEPPRPREARPWTVDEGCHAQVADLDGYV